MCSATQCGFRLARSKEEVRDGAERRSAIGPGKPYWKMPLGSTGGTKGTGREGSSWPRMGTGGGGVVRVGCTVVDVGAIGTEG